MLENSGWTVEADALMDDWKRVELEEELEALMDAVDLLPERERRAVQLKYGEQRDTAQVAEAMGVAESTARKYLLNARRLLKRALYENGDERDGD